MVPYASSPGMDLGITGDDYAWLLRQCKAKADWQLNFRISFAGRLTKCPPPSFEYRGKPTYSYALGRVPYIGDGRSLGGQTAAGDYIYTRTRPFCCLTADSAAPPVDACGPPFGDFRARVRQELTCYVSLAFNQMHGILQSCNCTRNIATCNGNGIGNSHLRKGKGDLD